MTIRRFRGGFAFSGLTVAVAVAAVATNGAFAGPTSRHGAHTLQIISTTEVQTGPSSPRAGARYSFYDEDTGQDKGHDLFDCTITNRQGIGICQGQFNLSRGTISVTTVGNLAAPALRAMGEITGGTGAYAGAKGTVVVAGTLAVTPFTFYFEENRS